MVFDMKLKNFISTNPVSEDSFSHSKLPIFKNVSREGIEV